MHRELLQLPTRRIQLKLINVRAPIFLLSHSDPIIFISPATLDDDNERRRLSPRHLLIKNLLTSLPTRVEKACERQSPLLLVTVSCIHLCDSAIEESSARHNAILSAEF